jgi:hypothetical protein
MRIRISIEQTMDVEQMLSDDISFDMYAPDDMSLDDKVDYLVNRFVEDIDTLVRYDEVRHQILVEYLED